MAGTAVRCPGCGAKLGQRFGEVLQIQHAKRTYIIRGGTLEAAFCSTCDVLHDMAPVKKRKAGGAVQAAAVVMKGA